MKRRNLVRILSYAAALMLAVTGLYLCERSKNTKIDIALKNSYAKNLNLLEASVNNISDCLDKASYLKSGTDLLSLSATLLSEGETAKNALAALPGGEKRSSTLYKFLSQVGNYALSVSKSSIDGEISNEESNRIAELSKTAKVISRVVDDVNKSYSDIDEFAKIMNEKIKARIDISTLSAELDGLEEDLNDYPTLIYDGPFSDNILDKEPLMTKNAKILSRDECLKAAEKFFDVKGKLTYSGEQNGKILCYRFEGDDITCCVTKNGGFVTYMRKYKNVENEKISPEKATLIAKEFLQKNSLYNMKETYYYTEDGECVINFAYSLEDTLCYTDLIKVGVALDNGEITFYEAVGYITNHYDRNLEKPLHTAAQAKEKVDKKLSVLSTRLCIIPTDSGSEIRCYEFACETADKQTVYVYVTDEKLNTEKVLLVEKSAAGVLVK